MVVLIDGIRYQLTTPKSEAALENAIQSNYKHIFGPDSFYFDIKKRIKSKAGVVSIPDGYVICFTSPKKARLVIIEVELASHSIYSHVIPQLSKFNSGIEDSSAKRKLVDILYNSFDDDEVLKARLKQQIKSGEVYKFISDLVSEKPLIVVAIDQRTAELAEAIKHIGGEVRVVEFKTFRREGLSDDINAYSFEPICTASELRQMNSGPKPVVLNQPSETSRPNAVVRRPQRKQPCKLPVGLELRNVYKEEEFTAEVVEGGKVKFGGKIYESVSGAAVAAIQSTGSTRGTEDGWRWWKFTDKDTGEEKVIDDLRK